MFIPKLNRGLGLAIVFMLTLTPATAALIGNALDLPLISFRNVSNSATTYNAATDTFKISSDELNYFDGATAPISITNGQLNLEIKVNGSGALVMNGAAQDLTLSGDVTIGGTPYSGVLLRAKVIAFGFDNSPGTTDQFDFQLSGIDGALAPFYPSGLGLTLTSENSNFNENFTVNFNGRGKGNVGGVDVPPLKAALGDFVWEDLDMDGFQNGTELGIENITVNLLSPGVDTVCNSADDQFIDTTSTDINGMYGFSELDAGDYCVEFEAAAGYVYSPQDVGSDTSDSDANPTTGKTTNISLAPGDNDLTWDAGLYLEVIYASLGDFVWEDLNMNGIQELTEPGIENVTVNLYSRGADNTCDTAGLPDESTATNTAGYYNFIDLTPGNYCVEFVPPNGFVFSPVDQGGDDSKDSDADTSSGKTIVTTLDPGENDPSWDTGLYQPVLTAALGNFVWLDLNMDGIQDDAVDEPGIEDITVNLLSPGVDNLCNTGDEVVVDSTTTDINGNYGFNDLQPGEYCVEFAKPTGFVFSPVNTTTNELDSDADLLNGQTTTITLIAGDNDLTWDAGLYPRPPAALGDRVWNDLNADGVQDCVDNGDGIVGSPGDAGAECNSGISGVTVSLLINPNGDASCDSGDEFVADSTVTNGSGFYEFTELDPEQEYCVRFDQPSANTALACEDIINPGIGAQFSSANEGADDAIDSDAKPMTGQTGNISLNAGDFDRRWDAGVYCPAKIGDMLVEDRNRDGIQGDLLDEPGVDGQLVQLVKCEGGVPGTDILDSRITENGGMYMFNPLPPGEYAVIFNKPGDTEFSPGDQGGDDNIDCDTDPNGYTACLTLEPNEYNQSVDACVNVPPAGLGDFVFEDKNVNGMQDGGEPGINGVTVNLLLPGIDGMCNTNDDMPSGNATTTGTMGNGGYEFTGLNPGTYCVEFDITSLPDDFCTTDGFALGSPSFTLANQGADDAVDSDADVVSGKTANIVLVANQFDPSNDAGIYCPAKIGDRVWEDTNSNGLQDGTESGVPGLEVSLFECGPDGIAGTADDVDTGQSRITDNLDGRYMFGAEPGVYDLPPGDYFVQFSKPFDRTFTSLDAGDDAIDSDCGVGGFSACTSLSSREVNLSRDCGIIPPPPPNCDLVVDKTCKIETPPPATFDKCRGKLQEFTVTWTGGDINISGLPNNAPNGDVTTGQHVTFFGPFSSNDVFINITGAVSGQSKFHMSCSDEDFNSPDDCGKLAGNAKSTSGFINEWKLEGFVDAENTVLECSSDSAGDFPVQQSCSFTPELASCDLLGKPTSLTFTYTGGGCSDSSNGQDGDKTECSGDINGMLGVSVVAGNNDLSKTYAISTAMVAPGEEFTITADKFDSNSRIDISNAGGTESNGFHTSCSQPLEIGDKFGSLELVGFNDVTVGTDVLYGYTVTNNGDPLNNVSIVDNKLGVIADMLTFDMGQTRQFTQLGSVSTTTTNLVTVTGSLANGVECPASDELTVEVVQVMTPVSCSDIKDITALSMVWNGSETVDIITESGEVFNNVSPGNQITFQEAGTGNDVEVYIQGATFSATSKFHVSCSDVDMNGSDDCGTHQGDGKNNDAGFNNQWLLDGMTGQSGAFSCGLDNTGVVQPEAGSASGVKVSGAPSLKIQDDKIKWRLSNTGELDVYITEVVLTWPAEHEQVKKFKLDGDFAKDVFDGGQSTSVPADKAFESDDSKRRLEAGDDKNLEIEFTEKHQDNSQADYTILVTFDDGTVLSFN